MSSNSPRVSRTECGDPRERNGHDRVEAVRQHLLGLDAVAPQAGQPGGRRRIGVVERRDIRPQCGQDVAEHGLVEVDPTQVLDALGRPGQPEPRPVAGENGGVERAATQVVDGDPVALGHPVARRVGDRRRLGLGTGLDPAQARELTAWPSRSRLNGPQFAGCVTHTARAGRPAARSRRRTTQASSRAVRDCAENGAPPTTSGTESPMRRLNSRTTRDGSAAPCCSAASPTRISPSRRTNTTDGTCIARIPSPSISVRPPTLTAAAV